MRKKYCLGNRRKPAPVVHLFHTLHSIGVEGGGNLANSRHQSLLTKREREIFEYLILDHSTKEIAILLNISEKTVRNHISNTIQKLGVSSRTQAILELLRLKQLTL